MARSTFLKVRQIFSLEQVAERLGRDVHTIRQWEKGGMRIPKLAMPLLREMLRSSTEPVLQELRQPSVPFRFIDLFAGIGGTRLGFEAAGGHCVFTSEWNKYACQTYRANHADHHEIVGDIRNVHAADIPDHDVLVAGFPCQPFSLAGVSKKNSLGRSHGFADQTQGTLFFDITRILAEKRPRAFLLENVKNLRSHDKGNTFRVIMRILRDELGYHVPDSRIIDAAAFVPQHRERIFIAGFRENLGFDWGMLALPPDQGRPTLRAVLHRDD
jgi:DNA (cytosine-5)-methyltransferase 1